MELYYAADTTNPPASSEKQLKAAKFLLKSVSNSAFCLTVPVVPMLVTSTVHTCLQYNILISSSLGGCDAAAVASSSLEGIKWSCLRVKQGIDSENVASQASDRS